jgi:hypothetical protein
LPRLIAHMLQRPVVTPVDVKKAEQISRGLKEPGNINRRRMSGVDDLIPRLDSLVERSPKPFGRQVMRLNRQRWELVRHYLSDRR